jgi:hypothetical protein
LRQKLERLGGPFRSFQQTFAMRILANGFEQFAKRLLQRLKVLTVEAIHVRREPPAPFQY